MLDDLAAGRSRGIYRAAGWHSLRDLPRIDYTTLPLLKYDAFKSSWLYRMYFHWPVVFSRGCPHPCEYCAVQTYYQRSFRTRPVDEVLDDLRTIKALGANRILFLDDNPIGHPEAAKELFRAMIPLRIKWASQCTINIARDPELLDLAARSGCVSLSIGLESVNEDSLDSVRKGFNQPRRFAERPRRHPRQGHPGDRAAHGRARRRHGRHVPALAAVPHRQQDHVPEALHALPVPGHEVLRRHARGPTASSCTTGAATTTAARSSARRR